ncbi:hypothetical protein J2Z20_003444 [Paenibacillus sediminis]|uniref:Uncharacterized protein n=1 Tax=Paenibacillus sediminis TaxID=664909 RepID=A0ABS4H7M0_9BACL|nr:hypothetical protein [Paenibacillus sediminis]
MTDFKTGKRNENDRTQLTLYAKFVKESFQVGTEDQYRNELGRMRWHSSVHI